jgi:hypothetical protein
MNLSEQLWTLGGLVICCAVMIPASEVVAKRLSSSWVQAATEVSSPGSQTPTTPEPYRATPEVWGRSGLVTGNH